MKDTENRFHFRNNVRTEIFGSSSDNLSEYSQFKNISILPIIVGNIFKSRNMTKIKFAEPLITSTRYFTPYSNVYTCTPDTFSKDIFSTTVNENLKYDVHNNYYILDLESQLKESKNFVVKNSLKCNSEENNYEILMRKNNKNVSSKLCCNLRQQRNNTYNMIRNEKLNQTVSSVENYQNQIMIENSISNQSLCLVKAVKIDKKNPVITDVFSNQPLYEVDYLESNENWFLQEVNEEPYDNSPVVTGLTLNQTGEVPLNKPVIINVYADQNVHKVENEESKRKISVETDPVLIKKQLSNVDLCKNIKKKRRLNEIPDIQMILKSTMKKQKLNKIPVFNDALLYESEKKINSSIVDGSSECYTNTGFYSSEYTNIHNVSSCDKEINFINNESIGDLSTNKPPIQIGSTYSLNSNCEDPLQFHQDLKRVDNFYYTKVLNQVGPSADLSNKNTIEIITDCEITSDDAILSNPQENIQDKSNPKTKQDKFNHRYKLFPQPHNLTKRNMNEFLYSNNQDDSEDKELYTFQFELNNKSDIQIYTQLLDIFKDESLVFEYLTENERMFYNRELIPSETANEVTTNYLNKHLDLLNKIYGDPKYNKAGVSYLLDAPANVRNFSKR